MTVQLHAIGARVAAPPQHHLAHHHHAAHNRRGAVALVAGTVGVVTGAIPFLFPVAAVSGALALVLGASALRRVHRGEATNGRSARAAVLLGAIALVLAAVGLVVSLLATEEIAPPPATPAETAVSAPFVVTSR